MGEAPATAWIEEARADLGVADLLLEGGHPRHAAFFAHLAIEKALKGWYREAHDQPPPVTHNLVYLAGRTDLLLPEDLRAFLEDLNAASILNLYPDRLRFGGATQSSPPAFDAATTRRTIAQSRELMDWITDHLPHS